MVVRHAPNAFRGCKVDGAPIVFDQVAVAVEDAEVERKGFARCHDGRTQQASVSNDGVVNEVERVWIAECTNKKRLIRLGNGQEKLAFCRRPEYFAPHAASAAIADVKRDIFPSAEHARNDVNRQQVDCTRAYAQR